MIRKEVIEASLNQLSDIKFKNKYKTPNEEFYVDVLVSYLTHDTKSLETLIECRKESISRVFANLAELRLNIRSKAKNESLISEVLNDGDIEQNNLLVGEVFFVVAKYYETMKAFSLAYDFYRKAAIKFEDSHTYKKSLKSRFNAITSKSNFIEINPKIFIADYQLIRNKAIGIGDLISEGLALFNIGNEYQELKANNLALDYYNKAIECLRSDYGSLHYELAISQRCHLLLKMEKYIEAKRDEERIKDSSFPEIKASLNLIYKYLEIQKIDIVETELRPSWLVKKRRKNELRLKPQALGDMEEKLIKLLSDKSRDKFELIDEIFGSDQSDIQSIEFRFKALLRRVRKKIPGSVIFSGSKYHLSESIQNFSDTETTG